MGEVERRGEVERSLDELAAEINAEYRAFEAARNAMLVHALRAGELLLLAKERQPHGQWMGWLQQNFAGSDRTARDYMRVASRRAELEAELEAKRQATANLTLEEALRVLSTPKPEAPHQPERETRDPEGAPEAAASPEPRPSASVFSGRSEEGSELLDVPRREEEEWSEEERELLEALRKGETIVVNMRDNGPHANLVPWLKDTDQLDRVDRASKWGNPFEIPDDGDRETVVESYRTYYLPRKYSLHRRKSELKGRALGCWCAPEACHAQVLKEWVES